MVENETCRSPYSPPPNKNSKTSKNNDMFAFARLWCCFGSRQKARKPRGVPTGFDVDLEAGLVDAPQVQVLVPAVTEPVSVSSPTPEVAFTVADVEDIKVILKVVSPESVPLPEGCDEDLYVAPEMVPLPDGDDEDLEVQPEMVPLPEDDDDELEVQPEVVPLPEEYGLGIDEAEGILIPTVLSDTIVEGDVLKTDEGLFLPSLSAFGFSPEPACPQDPSSVSCVFEDISLGSFRGPAPAESAIDSLDELFTLSFHYSIHSFDPHGSSTNPESAPAQEQIHTEADPQLLFLHPTLEGEDDTEDTEDTDTATVLQAHYRSPSPAGRPEAAPASAPDLPETAVPYTSVFGPAPPTGPYFSSPLATDAFEVQDDSLRLRATDFIECGRLGEGAFGKVYSAMHCESQSMVAVKAIRKTADDASVHLEQAMLRGLSGDKHTLELLGSFHDSRNWYIVTPLYDGTLADEFRKWGGRVPKPLLAIYMAQLLLGLKHAHEHDVFHRDIKPANVLVNTQTHEAVIADYGLAVTGAELARRRALMGPGKVEIAGTYEYMSREVWTNGEYSEASDLFAAGCVLFEGHLGRPIWNRKGLNGRYEMALCTVRSGVDDWIGPDMGKMDKDIYSVLRLMMDTPADETPSVGEILGYKFFAGVDIAAIARGEIVLPEIGTYPVQADAAQESEMVTLETADEKTVTEMVTVRMTETEPGWDMVAAGGSPERRGDDSFCDPNMFDAGVAYRAGEDPLPEFNYTARILWPRQPASPPASPYSYSLSIPAMLSPVLPEVHGIDDADALARSSLLFVSPALEVKQLQSSISGDEDDATPSLSDDNSFDSVTFFCPSPSEPYTPTFVGSSPDEDHTKSSFVTTASPPPSPTTTIDPSSPGPSEPYSPTLIGNEIDDEEDEDAGTCMFSPTITGHALSKVPTFVRRPNDNSTVSIRSPVTSEKEESNKEKRRRSRIAKIKAWTAKVPQL